MTRTIVLSTCGTQGEARKIANDLVRRRLAACVNILSVNSCYRWKSRIVNGREWLLIIKTNSNVFPKLKRRILALHSYSLPELVSLKIDDGYRPYLEWLDSELLARK
jgi:periplasmic divalent cation tolerance protein